MSNLPNSPHSIEIYDSILGFKKLTDADLGRTNQKDIDSSNKTSNQTHIGLYNNIFKFFKDNDEAQSILIYDGRCETLHGTFHRIKPTGGGSSRSIGLRTGRNNDSSLCKKIRDICGKEGEWYIIWFSLANKTPVFILFNSESEIYDHLKNNDIPLDKRLPRGITPDDKRYNTILSYVTPLISEDLGEIDIETEIAIQTGNKKRSHAIDYSKATERMREIGRKGEELINQYFKELMVQHKITNVIWKNEDSESGEPYDFIVEQGDETIYLDVKTTGYDFSRPMVFSKQEIDFVANSDNNYAIYRVYRGDNANYCLRVCYNSKGNFQRIDNILKDCSERLETMTILETAKLSIDPNSNNLLFEEEITLDQ